LLKSCSNFAAYPIVLLINAAASILVLGKEPPLPDQHNKDTCTTKFFLEIDGAMSYSAFAVNNNGQVMGDSTTANEANHGFRYQNGAMLDLGTLGGNFTSTSALNNHGDVVGVSEDANHATFPFLWKNGVMTNLNMMLPPASGGGVLENGNPLMAGMWHGQGQSEMNLGDISKETIPAGASCKPRIIGVLLECRFVMAKRTRRSFSAQSHFVYQLETAPASG
jgi:probable HAF family extracellular repeat protein